MNTNVGDMPLDIFADYTSDMLDEEWYWEYIAVVFNNTTFSDFETEGCGSIFYYHQYKSIYGHGDCHVGLEMETVGFGVKRPYIGSGPLASHNNGNSLGHQCERYAY